MRKWLSLLFLLPVLVTLAQDHTLVVVELNVENLFDCRHDSLKEDTEFLPDGSYHWTRKRYWQKLNRTGQTIVACGGIAQGEGQASWTLPDLVGLCEVENDSCLSDLTRRSLLRTARYEYVMSDSPDLRGVDVALLYSPFSFRLLASYSLRVPLISGMKPTRDILYAAGEVMTGDTLHVFVLHAPSRSGGERESRPFRLQTAKRLCAAIDSIRSCQPTAKILVMGDFNDYADDASLRLLYGHEMVNVSRDAKGQNGAKGTYRYQGDWGSLDQMVVSRTLAEGVESCRIHDAEFLLEADTKYGGVKPRRNYLGPRYLNGYSDHLPLVLRLRLR